MEFKIKEDKEEKVVQLSLEKDGEEVTLVGMDDNGDDWSIMTFRNGRFYRHSNIKKGIGIEIDEEGRIKEKV